MLPERSRIPYLLSRYQDNTCTESEFRECMDYFSEAQNDPLLLEWMEEEWELLTGEPYNESDFGHLYPEIKKVRYIPWAKIVAAASVILVVTFGLLYINKKKTEPPPVGQSSKPSDIGPGGNKAVLTLGNGSKIILDSARNGSLARQGNTVITKTGSGLLEYSAENTKQPATVYNTLSTPRGGQYQLSLPDGTKVWLNSASSITYPTSFNTSERNVSVTGEVYFEVAKDKTKPFHVRVGSEEVTVLGTHFNINAYPDEASVSTTLLEGSVKIKNENHSEILKPGEQARVEGQKISLLTHVDLDQVIAWKSGFFEFDRMDLPTIMRQVSRWYDVDIIYQTNYPDARFGGRVSRQLKLSEILELLETGGVHTRLENKKLTIIP